MGGRREHAALDEGDMLPHRVDFSDGRSAPEQEIGDGLFLREGDTFRGSREKRGAAAGYQRNDQVGFAAAFHEVQHPAGRGAAPGIGNGMGRLDLLDDFQPVEVPVLDRDEYPR